MKKLAVVMVAVLSLAMVGVFSLRAEDKPKAEGSKHPEGAKAPAGKVSPEDVDAAIKAIEEAKKAIGEDKKKEALEKLDEAVKALAKIKAAATATGGTVAGASETFTGVVESTNTQKRPRLVVGETRYEMKPSEKADAGVKETLANISSGEVRGRYVVKGSLTTIGERTWIMVDSIAKE